MIRSMTGFGQAESGAPGVRVQAEIRSVNHRYGEISLRLPREYTGMEETLKREVRRFVKRGRVDAYVNVDNDAGLQAEVRIDWALADRYRQAAEQLGARFGLENSLTVKDLLAVPGILLPFEPGMQGAAEEAETAIREAFADALGQLVRMREAEGGHLREDLLIRLGELIHFRSRLTALAPSSVEDYRQRLGARMREILEQGAVDDQRIAMEAAIFAERSSVDEELTRLASHFNQFAVLLDSEEPAGRKLDFLIQEMNREVNTIGSKANHAGMSAIVVEMKAELEKIREQVQNIE